MERSGPPSLISARNRRRFLAIARLVAQVYGGYKAIQVLEKVLGAGRVRWMYHRHHQSAAELAYRTATQLQGLLIKACQFLGTRADILPQEYIDVLSQLQDRVPARPYAEIAALVEAQLGRPLHDVFLHFDPRPLAAASLAQVHRARLHDGREVAVKVQYLEIPELVEIDVANLSFCARMLARAEPSFDLRMIIRELGKYVRLELDFDHEAQNATRIRANLLHRQDVAVPEIVPELSTSRLLVMEYLPGIRATDVDALAAAHIDKQEVARLLTEVFCHQILVDGFFHADPHPGNILVQPGPKLVLLDFGLAKDLPPAIAQGVVQLTTAILAQDRDAIAAAFTTLGFRTRNGDNRSLIALSDAFLGQAVRSGKAYADQDLLERFSEELPRALRDNPVVEAPTDLLLLVRVLGLLSGIGKQLDSRVDPMSIILPFLTQR
jgi:predicted unusual protein kinase regulating ubiquinone biosynthesis (AarF/ABC1/UbiB family)